MQDDRRHALASAWESILAHVGQPGDTHTEASPPRIARFWDEWITTGRPPPRLTTFPNEPRCSQVVCVRALRFYSLCAHHALPFYGTATIAYIPGDKVLGLSKFARVLDHFAHRPQVQERLGEEVARYLDAELSPSALAVVLEAEHLCMAMRGVERPGATTITSALRGAFFDNPSARAELLTFHKGP